MKLDNAAGVSPKDARRLALEELRQSLLIRGLPEREPMVQRSMMSDEEQIASPEKSITEDQWLPDETSYGQPALLPSVGSVTRKTKAAKNAFEKTKSALGVSDDTQKIDTSYRIQHTAPSKEGGAPLFNLSGTYPDDVYTHGAKYYGHGVPYDQKAAYVLSEAKNNPDKMVTIYRAVPYKPSSEELINQLESQKKFILKTGKLPKDALERPYGQTGAWNNTSEYYDHISNEIDILKKRKPELAVKVDDINPGDWITVTREYAKDHGEGVHGKGRYKIISKKVPAKHIFTDGNSIHEYGYDPR